MSYTFDNIAVLSIAVLLYGLIILFYAESVPEDVLTMIFLMPLFAATIMSFSLSQHYRKIVAFQRAYILLGLSTLFYAIAEILWVLLGHLGLVQYPSSVDIFYTGYFIFAILHPIAILKFFDIRPKRQHLLLFFGIVALALFLYFSYSYEKIYEESYYYGIFFVTLTSIQFGVSVLAILSLQGRQIFKVWVLIGVAFAINSITDIHYYISENYKDWSVGDWENIAWFVAQIMIVYVLLEHRKKYKALQS